MLAVVAGSPAQAANTSGEYLIDHDNDPDTAMVREFAGRDRYQTAMKLAERFAQDSGGLGAVQNAFVASGESLVDAVSVAGLAGFLDAPVLLTRPDSLHRGVANFIEDYGVSNIHVLGGEAAVSADVFDALEDLVNKPSVNRIFGDNRYATAARIAAQLQGESWCGTNENSAILASGANDALFDAVAIGPVANRLELPVLLTDGDMLVDEVLSYIDSADIEYVVIVGSTASVTAAVEQALNDADVDVVKRIAGDSPGEISVAIAEEIIDGQSARLLTHVLADTLKRIQPPGNTPVEEPALRTLLSISATNVFTKAPASGPVKFRRLEIVTQSAHALPMPRDLVDIPDGFDRILSGDNKGDPIDSDADTVEGVQRQDNDQSASNGPGETSIANGYGDNGAANGINGSGSPENDFNYRSESRIVRSSTVPVPAWSAFGG